MTREEADKLKEDLGKILEGYKSYAKVVPTSGADYRVIVVQHDKHIPELPANIAVLPGKPEDLKLNLVSVPSHAGKDLDIPRSPANRSTEPTLEFRWRNREIQDIVKRIAMRPDLQNRIASVAEKLEKLEKLAADRDEKIDAALEIIQKSLLHHDYKKTHPLWRLLVKIQKTYDLELMEELVEDLVAAKFDATDPTLQAAREALSRIQKHPGILPTAKDFENMKLAKQTEEYLVNLEKVCSHISVSLNRLGLEEEAQQMKAMAGAARDIYAVVTRLHD